MPSSNASSTGPDIGLAAALVIKASSDPFANPAYKPTPAPRPSIMPKAPNAINDAADKAMQRMMPQVKAVAHYGQHGFIPQMQFKDKQLVGVTQPHFQKPGTTEFSHGLRTMAPPPPDMPDPLSEQYYPGNAEAWVRMHVHNPKLMETVRMAPNMDALMDAEDYEGVRSTLQTTYEKTNPAMWARIHGGAIADAPDPFGKPTMQSILDHIKWTGEENQARADMVPVSDMTIPEIMALTRVKKHIGYSKTDGLPYDEQLKGLHAWIPRLIAARQNPSLMRSEYINDYLSRREGIFDTDLKDVIRTPLSDKTNIFDGAFLARRLFPLGPKQMTAEQAKDAYNVGLNGFQNQPAFHNATILGEAPTTAGHIQAANRAALRDWRNSVGYGLDVNYQIPETVPGSNAHADSQAFAK